LVTNLAQLSLVYQFTRIDEPFGGGRARDAQDRRERGGLQEQGQPGRLLLL
jgi:hypothetical protein